MFILNTNDLRYIKTEKILSETFYILKKKRTPFTLTQLCKEALINKTTFYKHYETLEDFEHFILKKFISELYAQCPHLDCAFSDTRTFIQEINHVIKVNQEAIDVLFQNNHTSLTNISEEVLLDHYLKTANTHEQATKIKFAIGGSARVLTEDQNPETYDLVTDMLIKAIS